MNAVWIGIGVLFLLLLMLPFTHIRIEAQYRRVEQDDRLTMKVSWLRVIRMTYRVSLIEWSQKQKNVKTESALQGTVPLKKRFRRRTFGWAAFQRSRRQFVRLRSRIVHLYGILRSFLSHVVCERLVWVSSLGTGDAAETGVITGMVWGIKSSIVGVAGSYIRWVDPPRLDVIPRFQEKRLETEVNCIIRFRVGHAILAVIRLLVSARGKGDERKWQNIRYRA